MVTVRVSISAFNEVFSAALVASSASFAASSMLVLPYGSCEANTIEFSVVRPSASKYYTPSRASCPRLRQHFVTSLMAMESVSTAFEKQPNC